DARGRVVSSSIRSDVVGPIFSSSQSFGVDGAPRARQRSVAGGPLMTDVFEVDFLGRVVAENDNIAGVAQLRSGDLTNDSVDGLISGSPSARTFGFNHESDQTTVSDASGSSIRGYDALHRLTSRSDVLAP